MLGLLAILLEKLVPQRVNMEFLKNLDTFQIVLLAGGILLLWPVISQWIIKAFKIGVNDNPSPSPVIPNVSSNATPLSKRVAAWENLILLCEEEQLDSAIKELQKVFPLLVAVKSQKTNGKET